MIDIREALERETDRFHQEPDAFERLLRGRDRKQRNRRVSAAVLAIVLTLLSITGLMRAFDDSDLPATEPTISVTPTPSTAAPAAAPDRGLVHRGQLNRGTYQLRWSERRTMNVQFTVPVGWTWDGRSLSKGGVGMPDGAAIFFFAGPLHVYADPCHWTGVQSDRPTGMSVLDLVSALAAQPMRSATTPFERYASLPDFDSVPPAPIPNSLPGMAVELTVPADINFADCDRGQFRSWGPEGNARSHQGPGQRDLVWAVDLLGNGVDCYEGICGKHEQRLIIDAASFPSTPAEVMSEMEAILGSIVTGHWG